MAFKVADAYVDVDFRVGDAQARIDKALAGKTVKVRVDVDDRTAESAISRFGQRASAWLKTKTMRVEAETAPALRGVEQLGAKVEAATRSRTVPVDADTTAINRKLAVLDRRQLRIDADTEAVGRKLDLLEAQAKTATGDRKLKIDADIAAARAKLAALDLEAEQVAAARAQIQIDVDSASAQAQLAAAQVATSALDGRRATVTVDADVASALAKIGAVSAALVGLGSVAAAGLGLAAGAGAVAAGGIGAFAASLTGVGGAVKALGEANKAAGGSAGGSASQHNQLASAMDRVKSSQAALRNARLDADSAARRSAEAVADARRRLEQAERSSASAAEQASRRTAAAAAREQAAVESLQRAQEDLTRARKDAARQLEDLDQRTKQLALDERAAQDDLEDAKKNLDRLGSRADQEARERAQLAYEQAKQRLENLHLEQQRTAEDKADADAKGLDGSDQVQSAQERILQIQQEITAAQEATNEARAAEAEVARKSAEDIAEANRRVAEAQAAAADQRRHSEQSVAQAAQAVVEAQRAVQNASQAAGGGGAAAMNKLNDAMAGLTPTAQAFARYLRGFIDGPLADLRKTGQDNLIPGLQRGLEALEPVLEQRVTPALGRFSRTLGSALEESIPLAGRLTASMLDFATTSLRGLAPLQGVLERFAGRLDGVFRRLEESGAAEKAMGVLVDILDAFLTVIPPIIEDATNLAVALGPGLTAVAQAFAGQISGLVSLFVDWAPQINAVLTTLAPFVPAIVALTTAFATMRSVSSGVASALQTIGGAFRGAAKDAEGAASGAGKFSGFLGGPWGIALTGATLLLGAWIDKHTEARARVAELTAAIERDSGAVGENTRAKVINSLETDGVLKAAKDLGINLRDVTEASLGNAEAMRRVNEVLDVDFWKRGSGDLGDYAANVGIVRDAVNDQSGALRDATESYKRSQEAGAGYNDSLTKMDKKSRDAKTATDRLDDAIRKITGGFLSSRDAETRYYEAVDRATAAVKENGRTLDVHTEKGRANRDAMSNLVRASLDRIQALKDSNAPAAVFNAALDAEKEALKRAASQMTTNKTEIGKYAGALNGIPKAVGTSITLDTRQAEAALRTWNANLNAVAANSGIPYALGLFPKRAAGGPVTKGQPYVVGEERPELFVPNQDGMIIPDLGLVRNGPAGAAGISQVGGTTAPSGSNITINSLVIQMPATLGPINMLSAADRAKFARGVRDEIVKLEGAMA